jgi:hypothetical protein
MDHIPTQLFSRYFVQLWLCLEDFPIEHASKKSMYYKKETTLYLDIYVMLEAYHWLICPVD